MAENETNDPATPLRRVSQTITGLKDYIWKVTQDASNEITVFTDGLVDLTDDAMHETIAHLGWETNGGNMGSSSGVGPSLDGVCEEGIVPKEGLIIHSNPAGERETNNNYIFCLICVYLGFNLCLGNRYPCGPAWVLVSKNCALHC